jgi:hypothetical protein
VGKPSFPMTSALTETLSKSKQRLNNNLYIFYTYSFGLLYFDNASRLAL